MRHGGLASFDQGRTVVVETNHGMTVMLTSRRMVPFSLQQLRSCGLDPSEFKILVDIPGIPKEDLNIALVGRTLTIGGNKTKPEDLDEKQLRVGERFYGRCHRTFEFDCDVDGDNVSATVADGVLLLAVPKREEEKARKIEIKAG